MKPPPEPTYNILRGRAVSKEPEPRDNMVLVAPIVHVVQLSRPTLAKRRARRLARRYRGVRSDRPF